MAHGRRRPAAPRASVERFGHEQREVGHGAADGRLHLAVDRLGPEHEPRLQASLDTAPLIDAAQRVGRLGEAGPHGVNLRAEPAQGEEHAPSHLATQGLGEDEARARDVDRQCRGGGMVPELPSLLLQSREPAATGSNTCLGGVP
jgi:hypothetical protein